MRKAVIPILIATMLLAACRGRNAGEVPAPVAPTTTAGGSAEPDVANLPATESASFDSSSPAAAATTAPISGSAPRDPAAPEPESTPAAVGRQRMVEALQNVARAPTPASVSSAILEDAPPEQREAVVDYIRWVEARAESVLACLEDTSTRLLAIDGAERLEDREWQKVTAAVIADCRAQAEAIRSQEAPPPAAEAQAALAVLAGHLEAMVGHVEAAIELRETQRMGEAGLELQAIGAATEPLAVALAELRRAYALP